MGSKLQKNITDLGIAAVLGLLFLMLSLIRTLGDTNSAAFKTEMIEVALAQPLWGTALSRHLLFFAWAMILVHVVLGLASWLLAKLSRVAWPANRNSVRSWMLLWFVSLSLWALVANATWFPRSSLGAPYAEFASFRLHGLTALGAFTLGLGSLITWTLIRAAANSYARCPVLRHKAVIASVLIATATSVLVLVPEVVGGHQQDREKPHIILIGLDSLRTDAVFAPEDKSVAPFIGQFLEKSTVFSDTVTPLARTFPAWVSILSGRHPHTTGAVINLLPRELVSEGQTLPIILRDSGYKTYYAIDEVRFSNLDESYGFDHVIAPPIGSADFLLAFFGDTPLSNLLVNTRVGAWLFPFAHGNRAATVTYDPDTFIARLSRELTFRDPTFLAVHMTLAHWPYSWSTSPTRTDSGGSPDDKALYEHAVTRLDAQFKDLMNVLQGHGALENAIVVVLSDHGESLGEIDVRGISNTPGMEAAKSGSFGHGTSVLADAQYRVILGIRSFGNTALSIAPGVSIDAPASLEDIAPTLLEALGLQAKAPFDGISLLPLIEAGGPRSDAFPSGRIRFTETEFNPPGLSLGKPISPTALRDAASYYRIDPITDRIFIRPEYIDEILAARQYAALRNGNILASLPTETAMSGQRLVFIDKHGSTTAWIEDPDSATSNPEVAVLWEALSGRFPILRGLPIVSAPSN